MSSDWHRQSRHRDEARHCTRSGCGHPQRRHERSDAVNFVDRSGQTYTGACTVADCECPAMQGAEIGMNSARRNF